MEKEAQCVAGCGHILHRICTSAVVLVHLWFTVVLLKSFLYPGNIVVWKSLTVFEKKRRDTNINKRNISTVFISVNHHGNGLVVAFDQAVAHRCFSPNISSEVW